MEASIDAFVRSGELGGSLHAGPLGRLKIDQQPVGTQGPT